MRILLGWIGIWFLTSSLLLGDSSIVSAASIEKEFNPVLTAIQPVTLNLIHGETQVHIKTTTFLQDGITMIPVADLFTNTGFRKGPKSSNWMDNYTADRIVKVESTIFNRVRFEDYSSIMYVEFSEGFNGDVNEEYVFMPTTTMLREGRLYIPLKFVATLLNYDVSYKANEHTVTLHYWGDQTAEDTTQLKELVNRYTAHMADGSSSDLSLYTPEFLEHDDYMIEDAFSDGRSPEAHLELKDWTIRYLVFMSHNEAAIKIPYLEEGNVSRVAGATWLYLIRKDGQWKVDVATHWSNSQYKDGLQQQIDNLNVQHPDIVTSIKKAVYSAFQTANANKRTVEGTKVGYKTYPKDMTVLYADEHISYLYVNYNWSFKRTEANYEKYDIHFDTDFITMTKDSTGNWKVERRNIIPLGYNTPVTDIRGNYQGREDTFMAFDDYYLNKKDEKSSISFF
ncbi:stalk domain-containing protein [Paenibacillus sp. WLX1005]|uniref:stalk domain-containing protein n=1 Tax=Paenibacillus sp. WLX1005 TaxID=3243766 RepID=UPI003983E2B4